MPYNSKTPGCRAKSTKGWHQWGYLQYIYAGTILGHPVLSLGIKEHRCNLQLLLTAGAKQSAKVLGPLVKF